LLRCRILRLLSHPAVVGRVGGRPHSDIPP
jgi:hypothetical protein